MKPISMPMDFSHPCQFRSHSFTHKKLKREGLTFARLLEDVRRRQALTYMQDRTKPLVEIAEQLGFSELSAFSRAFKRWMGTSPAEYRSVRLS